MKENESFKTFERKPMDRKLMKEDISCRASLADGLIGYQEWSEAVLGEAFLIIKTLLSILFKVS